MALTAIDQVDEGSRMEECIDNCLEATQASEWCADECIALGDSDMSRCIRLCRDIADIASLHARLMGRSSEVEADLAVVCADLCEEGATECDRHDYDHCRITADILRTCAASCRDMATA